MRRLKALGLGLTVLLVVLVLADFAAPYALMKARLGPGYDVGVLRWGRAHYTKPFNLTDQARSRRVGIALGGRGEALRLEWAVDVREGTPALTVYPFPIRGVRPLWREQLEQGGRPARR